MNAIDISRSAAKAALGFVLCVSTAAAQQQTELWGIQPATNQIVRVDSITGNVFDGFTPPGGALLDDQLFGGLTIAENGDTLLYQNPLTNPTDLFRLDPQTGLLLSTESMPAAGTPEFRAGLSFESAAGEGGADAIFAVNNGAPVQRQDGYGNAVLVDHTPGGITFAGALGGDDNGRHFIAASGQIMEFDPLVPGPELNFIPAPAGIGSVGGLAFDGMYIYLSEVDGQLFTIDPDSGAILNSVSVQGGPLIGLASRTRVPEPASFIILGLLSVVAASIRRQC